GVALESSPLAYARGWLFGIHVPQFDGLIAASRGERFAIGTEREGVDLPFMGKELLLGKGGVGGPDELSQFFASVNVPQLQVGAWGICQELAVRCQRHWVKPANESARAFQLGRQRRLGGHTERGPVWKRKRQNWLLGDRFLLVAGKLPT